KIHLVCDWGTGDLILPEEATAEVDLDSSWFGTLRADVNSLPNPPAPHFVITGTGQGATVRVRHKRVSKWSSIFGGGLSPCPDTTYTVTGCVQGVKDNRMWERR